MKLYALKWYDEKKLFSDANHGQLVIFKSKKAAKQYARKCMIDDTPPLLRPPNFKRHPEVVSAEAKFS